MKGRWNRPYPRIPVADRFWPKVLKTDGCWLWTGAKAKGYGRFGVAAGDIRQAHQVAWELTYGPILNQSLWVLHKCDVRECVNPAHLFLGTHDDNMQDMVEKGRHVKADHRGTNNGRAKLTPEQVQYIRRNYKKYSRDCGGPALGKKFGITGAQVSTIIAGKEWTHV